MRDPCVGDKFGLAICTIQLPKITCNVRLKLFDACLKLLVRKILVSLIDGLELASVNGDVGMGE